MRSPCHSWMFSFRVSNTVVLLVNVAAAVKMSFIGKNDFFFGIYRSEIASDAHEVLVLKYDFVSLHVELRTVSS